MPRLGFGTGRSAVRDPLIIATAQYQKPCTVALVDHSKQESGTLTRQRVEVTLNVEKPYANAAEIVKTCLSIPNVCDVSYEL